MLLVIVPLTLAYHLDRRRAEAAPGNLRFYDVIHMLCARGELDKRELAGYIDGGSARACVT